MSGRKRRASEARFWDYWHSFIWLEEEMGYEILKVDWIRGQIQKADVMHNDPTVIIEPLNIRYMKQHVESYSFPHQARNIWCDPETCEPVNDKERAKEAKYRAQKGKKKRHG